jgi:hypothetical protein
MKVERREDFIKMMAAHGIGASTLHLRNDRHSVFNAPLDKTPNLDLFYDEFVHIGCGCLFLIQRIFLLVEYSGKYGCSY